MAQPTTARFGAFLVLLGSGTSPIVYAAPCGFTSKSLVLTKDLTEVNIPDCDDPDAVAWIGRDASSLSAAVTGEGIMAAESVDAWLAAFEGVVSIPVKLVITFPAKTIVWTGLMHIATLTIGAEQGGRVTLNASMSSDGQLTRVTNIGQAPVFTVLPTISGLPKVGTVLTASPGTQTGTATIAIAYQWKSNGVNVGTNTATYTPVTGDIGNTITCVVTATNGVSSTSKTAVASPAVVA